MSKSTKENNTSYRITEPFFVAYDKVFQCGAIEYIEGHKREVIEWDIYSATIYSYLLTKFNYFKETYISQERISADCNVSINTVSRRLKSMADCKIITTYENTRSFGGTWKVTRISNIVNITDSPLYKMIPNQYRKEFFAKLNKRKEKLLLLKGEVLQKGITQKQAINLYHNRNYELMTGEYLQGDKLNSKLYIKDRENKPLHSFTKSFTAKDELKHYEVIDLLGDQVFEPEPEEVEPVKQEDLVINEGDEDIIPF